MYSIRTCKRYNVLAMYFATVSLQPPLCKSINTPLRERRGRRRGVCNTVFFVSQNQNTEGQNGNRNYEYEIKLSVRNLGTANKLSPRLPFRNTKAKDTRQGDTKKNGKIPWSSSTVHPLPCPPGLASNFEGHASLGPLRKPATSFSNCKLPAAEAPADGVVQSRNQLQSP